MEHSKTKVIRRDLGSQHEQTKGLDGDSCRRSTELSGWMFPDGSSTEA